MAGGYDNTLTLSSMTNVAQNDIIHLTAPETARLGVNTMDAFDRDLNFEGEHLLYALLSLPPLLPCHSCCKRRMGC
jgi:hypothetical protein